MLDIIIIIIVLYKLFYDCFCSNTDSFTMTINPAYATTVMNSSNINSRTPDYEEILYVITLIF